MLIFNLTCLICFCLQWRSICISGKDAMTTLPLYIYSFRLCLHSAYVMHENLK
uniref:Uncharacterized protein n=1 Tax=Setaria italica TaxID=4555 RepID=K3ZPB2_SETIT